MARRRYARVPYQQTTVPSAARTTNGNGPGTQLWAGRVGAVTKLDVTAGSGGNLTVTVQDSPDGTTWTTRDTFGVKTGVAAETRNLPSGLDIYQRFAWTISAGSFTFSCQFASSAAQLV